MGDMPYLDSYSKVYVKQSNALAYSFFDPSIFLIGWCVRRIRLRALFCTGVTNDGSDLQLRYRELCFG